MIHSTFVQEVCIMLFYLLMDKWVLKKPYFPYTQGEGMHVGPLVGSFSSCLPLLPLETVSLDPQMSGGYIFREHCVWLMTTQQGLRLCNYVSLKTVVNVKSHLDWLHTRYDSFFMFLPQGLLEFPVFSPAADCQWGQFSRNSRCGRLCSAGACIM